MVVQQVRDPSYNKRNRIALVSIAFLSLPAANAAPAWQVRHAGSPVNTEYHEAFSTITRDGLTLFISSDRPGGFGTSEKGISSMVASYDIYVTHRASLDSPWGPVVNLGANINTSASEHSPVLSPDGHYMYFMSARPGGFGNDDIYRSFREDVTDDLGWQQPENLGEGVNGPDVESCPVFYVSEEGSAHLFYIQIAGPNAAPDFRVSKLDTDTNVFAASRLVEISTPTADGHLDPWHGYIWGVQYPGGFGGSDIWQTERNEGESDLAKSWAPPVNVGSEINSEYEEQMPSATADGKRLFFMSDRPGGSGGMDIYEAVVEGND